MTPPLALIEHLQKVLYLLSMFFPVAAFFLFGLGLSYWRNRSEIQKFEETLSTHESLIKESKSLADTSVKLSANIATALSKTPAKTATKTAKGSKKDAQDA